MVSVIIPALNEGKTIEAVVAKAFNSSHVTEVIVVDDKSVDDTVAKAKKAGATIITSTKLGKGTSMKDGVLVATNEVLVFLDADILTYPDDVVDVLATPIIAGSADFVKSYFTRQAGRVTELVAKPLLSILNPNFPNFIQPLSGMIAGKKSLLQKIEFEEGYGVDIGILIDMHQMQAVIKEVNIGNIENQMQQLAQLGKMSKEVARTIIKKSGNLTQNLETYENIQVIREQMEFAIKEGVSSLKKIAVFDMDNTLLRGSFIQTAAAKFGFTAALVEIATTQTNPFIRTKHIARLLKGKSIAELLSVADEIPITEHAIETIATLRAKGFIVGLMSDSYDCITNHFKNKMGFDFSLANELEFSKSFATGEVKIPSFFLANDNSLCKHDYCKLNALVDICHNYGVDIKNTLVIGDGENDVCTIKKSGIGISFCSTYTMLDVVADYVVKTPDFTTIVALVD